MISISDLRRVSGIGDKTIERIKEQLEKNELDRQYVSKYDESLHLDVNKIHLGDCLELMNGIPDRSVDMILTDPPYLKAYSTGYRKNTERKKTEILNDRDFNLDALFSSYKRVAKEDAHIYIFGCWQTSDIFKQKLEQYFKIKSKIVWVKNNWSAGDLFHTYGQSYEDIWFATNGRKRLNGRRDRDCVFYDRVAGSHQMHLNQKPIELIEFLIEKSSQDGDMILDSFIGSGTTAIAAINTNRNYIGIELDERYHKIANDRITKE